MTRRQLLAMAATAGLRAQSNNDILGAAHDYVYQALELLSAHATPEQVTHAVRMLRLALDDYPSLGDAHYYRALCLRRLNRDPGLQQSDLEEAERHHSEAMGDRRDPFFVAVPKIGNLAAIGQKWALVIGISEFQPNTGAEPLGAAANDATAIAQILKDPAVGRFPPNQVFLLTNEAATTAAIKARLNYIATRAKPEDIVLTYVSTHGSARTDDLRQVSYLYTYDTDVTSRDLIFGSSLAMVDVSGIISSRCVAQRTAVIFDTCHSGAGAAQALSTPEVDRLREGAGRYVLSSCEADQSSYEDAGHGYFTASLIGQLRARKGCVAMDELFAAVSKEVSDKVARKYNKKQRPVMVKSDSAAQIVLGAAPGSTGASCL
jgi:uncharacterized caspase-like protein